MMTTWYILKNGKRWELWFEDDVCNERRLMSHYKTRKDAIALARSMSDIGDNVVIIGDNVVIGCVITGAGFTVS